MNNSNIDSRASYIGLGVAGIGVPVFLLGQLRWSKSQAIANPKIGADAVKDYELNQVEFQKFCDSQQKDKELIYKGFLKRDITRKEKRLALKKLSGSRKQFIQDTLKPNKAYLFLRTGVVFQRAGAIMIALGVLGAWMFSGNR